MKLRQFPDEVKRVGRNQATVPQAMMLWMCETKGIRGFWSMKTTFCTFLGQAVQPEARYNRYSAHFTCARKIEASDCSAAKLSNTKQKVEIKNRSWP